MFAVDISRETRETEVNFQAQLIVEILHKKETHILARDMVFDEKFYFISTFMRMDKNALLILEKPEPSKMKAQCVSYPPLSFWNVGNNYPPLSIPCLHR